MYPVYLVFYRQLSGGFGDWSGRSSKGTVLWLDRRLCPLRRHFLRSRARYSSIACKPCNCRDESSNHEPFFGGDRRFAHALVRANKTVSTLELAFTSRFGQLALRRARYFER